MTPRMCLYTKGCGHRFNGRVLVDFICKCDCQACKDATAAAIEGQKPERVELLDRWTILLTGHIP